MSLQPLDRHDRRLALGSAGLLRQFNDAEVLSAADVHVASRFGVLLDEQQEPVLLATALAVRAVRHGSICVDLTTVADLALDHRPRTTARTTGPPGAPEVSVPGPDLPWPEPDGWLAAVRQSRLVREQVLRLEGTRLYLDRYWREEGQVCDDLVERLRRPAPEVEPVLLEAGLARVFPETGYDEQRHAVRAAAAQWTTILTGGPGTGKTTAVAGLLSLVAEQHEAATGQRPRIALCAPTGKASARLQEAVDEAAAALASPTDRARVTGLQATTLHRLLGWRPDSSVRFRHHRAHRLPHDVVVVDETSMVSLTMMARLLEAIRPDARLVLVGDPDQLSSVEAGAVLADLVEGLGAHRVEGAPSPVLPLTVTHRYGEEIGALARALRDGDADAVLAALGGPHDPVALVDPDDGAAIDDVRRAVADVAYRMRVAADSGDVATALATLEEHRLLCAHREGPYGVGGWNRQVEQLVAERTGITTYDDWYSGRPVLVTANDKGQRLNNGDMGVTVRRADGRLRVVLADRDRRAFAPTRLPDVQTMHAMTVHKSQGSQADVVTVIMPPEDSRLLTRELFYTAVTRARTTVRVVGSEASVRAAVARKVQRASGLRERLRAALGTA